jgi:hypothetical protein
MKFINQPINSSIENAFINAVAGSAAKAIKRYFATIGATLSQYYSIPSVTVDRIVMDVYSPTGVTTGLPTGAPTPAANKYETLDFVYSGTIDEIGRNGSDYFNGRIANVNLYFGGTLIHSYAIDEDLSTTTVIVDSIGSNNGTAVNIVESTLFILESDEWITEEIWHFEPYTYDGSEIDSQIVQYMDGILVGYTYRSTFSGSGSNPGRHDGDRYATRALIGNCHISADDNPWSVTQVCLTTQFQARWQVFGTPPFSGTVSIDTVKEFMEIA